METTKMNNHMGKKMRALGCKPGFCRFYKDHREGGDSRVSEISRLHSGV